MYDENGKINKIKEEKVEKKDIRFIALLFKKLKQLQKEDRIFEIGKKEAKKKKSLKDVEFTVIAAITIKHLLKKTGCSKLSPSVTPVEVVEKLTNAVEEFLAIFEEDREEDTIAVSLKDIKEIQHLSEDSTDETRRLALFQATERIIAKYLPKEKS